MFGGCSARNFMIYQRATTGSFDRWAQQVGDESYTMDNLMPFFEKSMNFTPPDQSKRAANATPSWDESRLGTGDGPLSLTFPNWAYAFGSWATKAFTQMGISLLPQGFNNGEIIGQAYGMFTLNPATMERESSETSFLQSTLGNPNYYLYPLTMAKKIVFDDSLTAKGVIVESFDTQFTLSARREIILSAGVIGSPQLLQVSGVGPAEILEPLGIPVVADRPGVGQGMEDHIVFGISNGVNVVTSSQLGDPAFFVEQRRLFNEEASGLLTNPGADVIAFEKLPNNTRGAFSNSTRAAMAQLPRDWPEVEYIGFSSFLGDANVLADPGDGTSYATLSVVLVAPQSRGSVNITSADASVAPAINPAYLTARADEEVAVGGFKRAREFWAASSLDDVKVGSEAYPGSEVVSDAQILSAIRGSLQTLYHGSCTCAMGGADDPRAVIDSEARVYGVQGLRVVDASSFPSLPPGHPQSVICEYSRHDIH
jgi:choline dehydrogenase